MEKRPLPAAISYRGGTRRGHPCAPLAPGPTAHRLDPPPPTTPSPPRLSAALQCCAARAAPSRTCVVLQVARRVVGVLARARQHAEGQPRHGARLLRPGRGGGGGAPLRAAAGVGARGGPSAHYLVSQEILSPFAFGLARLANTFGKHAGRHSVSQRAGGRARVNRGGAGRHGRRSGAGGRPWPLRLLGRRAGRRGCGTRDAPLRALACMYAARRLGAPRATAQAGCSHQVSLV